jgi:hypothetical protein
MNASLQEAIDKMLKDLVAATNPFKECLNTEAVRGQLVADTLNMTLSREGIPDIEVKVVSEGGGKLRMILSIPAEAAVVLIRDGLMCSKCHQLDMAQVEDTDIEAMKAGYHPRATLKCKRCGEYWEKR